MDLFKRKATRWQKIQEQHSIGNYIVDFYCPQEKLVIELDGEDHFSEEGINYDVIKTQYINSIGIQVIRFENKWISEDP